MNEINCKSNFTREGRKLENQLFQEKIKEANESNLTKDKKENIREDLWKSFLEYRHLLAGYQRLFREYRPTSNLYLSSLLN